MDAKITIDKISDIVWEYESGVYFSWDKLCKAHRDLSCEVYNLALIEIDLKVKWNQLIYNRPTLESGKRESIASAEARADYEFADLYRCKKISEAIKNVSISMMRELKRMENE